MKREDIIGKRRPVKVKKLAVPDWGECYIRKLSPRERVQQEALLREAQIKPDTNYRARVVVLYVCDENGNRTFTDADAESIGKEPADGDAVDAICEAVQEWVVEEEDAAKKNSASSPN